MDLRFYLSLFIRRAHWFALMLVLCGAAGITLARLLPTVYKAEAQLVVESEQIPDALAASTVQTDATEQLQIIQQRILSRDTLIEMSNRLGIYAGERNRQRNADEIVEDLRSRIRIVTTGGTVTRGPVQATLVRVGFTAPNAALAAAVANDVVTLILREDVAMRTGVARQTLEFFEQEVTRLGQALSDRNAAILDFKQKHSEALPDSLEFRRERLAAAQERLLQLDRTETDLRSGRERLIRLHLAARSASGLPKSDEPKAFDAQLANLDKQIAALDGQREQARATVARLDETIAATPGNAGALDTLQRDYSNLRDQYDEAVAKKARAETGEMIEVLSKGQRISVIEQAVAPRAPDRPNRPLIAAAGVGAGFALGLALVGAMIFLARGIHRPAELTAALGITPFATLPLMETIGEIRRRRQRRIAGVFLAFAAGAGLLWAVDSYYQPLDLLLERALRQFSQTDAPRRLIG